MIFRRDFLKLLGSVPAAAALGCAEAKGPPPEAPAAPLLELPDAASAFTEKLQALLGVPAFGPDVLPGGRFLSFAVPGIPFPKEDFEFDAVLGSLRAMAAAANLSRLVDAIPEPSARYMTDGRALSAAYESALRQAEVASAGEPTPDDMDRLERDRATAGSLEPAYEQHRQRYERARLEYLARELDARASGDADAWRRIEPSLSAGVETALHDWITKGARDRYEQAVSSFEQVAGRAPALFFRRWREQLDVAERFDPEGHRFFLTAMRPHRLSGEGADAMWTSISISSGEGGAREALLEPVKPAKPAPRARVSFGRGGIVLPGKALRKVPQASRQARGASPVLELSVELFRATIVRPWMDPLVLRSRFWRFPDGREPLSDGGAPPSGSLPAYVSSLVIARNLRVELRRLPRGARTPGQRIGPCCVGPLSLEGGVVGDDCRSICATGPQIVAFICELVPRSPDPDPRLSW